MEKVVKKFVIENNKINEKSNQGMNREQDKCIYIYMVKKYQKIVWKLFPERGTFRQFAFRTFTNKTPAIMSFAQNSNLGGEKNREGSLGLFSVGPSGRFVVLDFRLYVLFRVSCSLVRQPVLGLFPMYTLLVMWFWCNFLHLGIIILTVA